MQDDMKAKLAKKMMDAGEGALIEVSGAELALILSGQMGDALAAAHQAKEATRKQRTPEPDHKAHLHQQDQAAQANAKTPQQVSFETAVKPLMCWLADNTCPHASVIVTSATAELLHGVTAFQTFEFVKD